MIAVLKQCPCCRFMASATSAALVYEALFHHYEAMHPKEPA
jgi:predicted small metal-binding protein